MEILEEIPLFPLNVVLLPRRRMPLHIFEPRYREMVANCIREDSPFGIVWGTDEEFRDVGCLGKVDELLERLPDGRLNIMVLGVRRFKVLERVTTHDLITASVEPYDDRAEKQVGDQGERVFRLYHEAMRRSLGWYRPPENRDVNDYDLSFDVAGNMQLTTEEQQALLELTSTNERLKAEEKYLEMAIDMLEQSFGKAGNGHVSPN
jgi:Lon protease-like protein